MKVELKESCLGNVEITSFYGRHILQVEEIGELTDQLNQYLLDRGLRSEQTNKV